MKRKAVIVGIGDYGDAQPRLTASITEAEHWKNLLIGHYYFQASDIRMLCNERATKLSIMERLEWLFTDVSGGDQLFFSFAGHGARLRRRNPNGIVHDNMDEAIVTYPEPGQDIEQYSLYDEDLARLVLLSRLPTFADLTFVLDCCFGGGFNLQERDQPIVRIPPDIRHREAAGTYTYTARFGECRRLLRNGQNPVIIASAPKSEQSPTESFAGVRRTVFGYHAIANLCALPQQSYARLQQTLQSKMLDLQIENAPVLSGNSARFDHPFLT